MTEIRWKLSPLEAFAILAICVVLRSVAVALVLFEGRGRDLLRTGARL